MPILDFLLAQLPYMIVVAVVIALGLSFVMRRSLTGDAIDWDKSKREMAEWLRASYESKNIGDQKQADEFVKQANDLIKVLRGNYRKTLSTVNVPYLQELLTEPPTKLDPRSQATADRDAVFLIHEILKKSLSAPTFSMDLSAVVLDAASHVFSSAERMLGKDPAAVTAAFLEIAKREPSGLHEREWYIALDAARSAHRTIDLYRAVMVGVARSESAGGQLG